MKRHPAPLTPLPNRHHYGEPVDRIVDGVLPRVHRIPLNHRLARMERDLFGIQHQDQLGPQQDVDVDRLGAMPAKGSVGAVDGRVTN